MPAELLTKNERAASRAMPAPRTADDELREWARQHLERVRRLKLNLAAFVVGMIVLTPIWALVESQDNGGFKRWSSNGNPGDWEPWILYVALVWGLLVAISALKVRFDRPTTEAEVEREVERLRDRLRRESPPLPTPGGAETEHHHRRRRRGVLRRARRRPRRRSRPLTGAMFPRVATAVRSGTIAAKAMKPA